MKAFFNRKTVACLLALLLLVSAMPLNAVGAEPSIVRGDWNYIHYELNLDTGEMVITGNGPIPYTGPYGDDFKHLPWYGYLDDIKTVRIEDGVTDVPAMTFPFCNNLTYIYIGADVQEIDAVSVLHSDYIECFEVSAENPYLCSENGVLYNKDKTTLLRVPHMKEGHYEIPDTVTVIAVSALQKCELLTSVTIPYGVTTIYQNAFFCCRRLTSLFIPDSVTKTDSYSFAYCEGVTELHISEGLTEISAYVFTGLTSLKHVVLPKNLYKIKAGGFQDCTALESVVMFNKLRDVHLWDDGCDNLKNIYYIGNEEELWKFNSRPDHLFAPYNLRYGIDGTLPNGLKWDLESNQRTMTVTGTGTLDGTEEIWDEYREFYDCIYVSEGVSGIENCIDGTFASFGTEKINGVNCRVYAKNYLIIFDANGGFGAPAHQKKIPGKPLTLSAEKPEREGYVFLGWAEHKNEETPTYQSGGTFEKNADTTLYAVWGRPSATGAAVAKLPSKTVYKVGEALNLAGAVMEISYNDGSVKRITEGFSASGYDPKTEGKQTVTLEYNGVRASFDVTVLSDKVSIASVTAEAGKTEYAVGETFDKSSVELAVTFSDGSTQKIADGFAVAGFDSSKPGVCTVTVSYEGVSTSLEIHVVQQKAESDGEEGTLPVTDPTGEQETMVPGTEPTEQSDPEQKNVKTDLVTVIWISAAVILLLAAAVVTVIIIKKKQK